MPSSRDILLGVQGIVSSSFAFAVAWHVVVGALLAALSFGWRPSSRTAGLLATVPLASVSVFASIFGNPFNGAVFAILAATFALVAWRSDGEPRPEPTHLDRVIGWAAVAFAWVYPHFLPEGVPALAYLIASPMGLIPCPTLSLVIGLTLLGHTPATRAWSLPLAIVGAFYAIFGVLRLHVVIDLALLVGTAALLGRVLARPKRALRVSISHG